MASPDNGRKAEEMETRAGGNATCSTVSWSERMVRRLAGTFILVSLLLAWKVSPGWMVLTVFVGANLLQSSFSGFCPAEKLFRHIEVRRDAGTASSSDSLHGLDRNQRGVRP